MKTKTRKSDLKALSLDERIMMVRMWFYKLREAMRQAQRDAGEIVDYSYCEILDIYDDALIIREGDEAPGYYRVEYSIADDGTVSFGPRSDWVPVEKEWVERHVAPPEEETVVMLGGAMKALDKATGHLGGYLVVWGDPDHLDLQGDFFTPDTDFDLDWDGEAKATVYFHHGLDPQLKRRKLSKAILKKDDVGIWMDTWLAMRDEYEQAIYQMAEMGKMAASSGTAAHLAERVPSGKAAWIKSWPIIDASLTPLPAEPRIHIMPVKALRSTGPSLLVPIGGVVPQASVQTAPAVQTDAAPPASDAMKARLQLRAQAYLITMEE